MTNDSKIVERIELYTWWIKNYSQKISPSQIKREACILIEKLEEVKKITNINYSSLEFLYKLQLFNFDVIKVEEHERKRRNNLSYFFA